MGPFLLLLSEQGVTGTQFQHRGEVCQTVVLTKHRNDTIFTVKPNDSFISSLIIPFPQPHNKYSCRTRVSYLISAFGVINWPETSKIRWNGRLLVSLGPLMAHSIYLCVSWGRPLFFRKEFQCITAHHESSAQESSWHSISSQLPTHWGTHGRSVHCQWPCLQSDLTVTGPKVSGQWELSILSVGDEPEKQPLGTHRRKKC